MEYHETDIITNYNILNTAFYDAQRTSLVSNNIIEHYRLGYYKTKL